MDEECAGLCWQLVQGEDEPFPEDGESCENLFVGILEIYLGSWANSGYNLA